MSANKPVTKPFSAELPGGTDFAQVDAHVIQPHEYDEIPELTEEWFGKAVFSPGGGPDLAALGLDQSGRRVTVSLDPEIAARLRARGDDWPTRVNAILREWLDRQPA